MSEIWLFRAMHYYIMFLLPVLSLLFFGYAIANPAHRDYL